MAQESSSKRAGEKLEQEVAKKQKMEDDKEKEDLKQCFEIVQYDKVAIDAIPLATKPASLVNFQIHRKGRNGYYEIMRADGSGKTYLLFSQLLKEFDREGLENLWKLVKAKHGNTRPDRVYKVEKALYGLHQAPRTWTASEAEGMLGLKDCLELILLSVTYTKVNAASMKVTTAERLQLLEEFLLSEG
ncbi:hypothetical protein Tco_0453453 [Tanacetum coccineum]